MTEMLADERRRLIVDRLRTSGAVRVVELAGVFAVAEETVRRDLRLLDDQGLLVRTHGGAVRSDTSIGSSISQSETSFEHRRRAMLPEKKAIASEAKLRMARARTIALDGSTTAWELAALLHDPELTVVTNSLMVSTLLASRPDGPQVISVGGTLDRKTMMFGGMIALDSLRHVHVDIFFCSCGGIDPVRGFSEPGEVSAQLKQQMLQMADRSILLADSTKFGSRAAVLFGTPADFCEIITDADAPSDAVDKLTAAGVVVSKVARN